MFSCVFGLETGGLFGRWPRVSGLSAGGVPGLLTWGVAGVLVYGVVGLLLDGDLSLLIGVRGILVEIVGFLLSGP